MVESTAHPNEMPLFVRVDRANILDYSNNSRRVPTKL